jgi:hypothetical protein
MSRSDIRSATMVRSGVIYIENVRCSIRKDSPTVVSRKFCTKRSGTNPTSNTEPTMGSLTENMEAFSLYS